MLEYPGLLTEMVERSGAKSIDLEAPESAAHLCSKCEAYAAGVPVRKSDGRKINNVKRPAEN